MIEWTPACLRKGGRPNARLRALLAVKRYFLARPDPPAPGGLIDTAPLWFEALEQAQQYVTYLGEQGEWRVTGLREKQFFAAGCTEPTWQIDLYGTGPTVPQRQSSLQVTIPYFLLLFDGTLREHVTNHALIKA